jgi:photosynthetic reaction center H subunit
MRDEREKFENDKNLYRLEDLDDYKVAEGDPDVRNWDVLDKNHKKIGKVDELIIDRTAMKVRYLDVIVKSDLLYETDEDQHILIPIGAARINEHKDDIVVDDFEINNIREYPLYTGEPFTREYEEDVRSRYISPSPAAGGPEPGGNVGRDDEFYHGPLYDTERFYGSRRKRNPGSERF